jgi:hypothetical protein
MTGSGMPMRFAKANGALIDVYQAATQMTDESNQTWPFTVDTLLDRALGPQGYYGFFTTNMHTDSVAHEGSEAIVASALARSVPVISAKQLLTWIDGRNGSSFSNISWNGTTMAFSVAAGAGANGLEVMVPAAAGAKRLLAIRRSGVTVPYRIETIKGISYAIFAASTNAFEAEYGLDETPPMITGVSASQTASSASITWNTNEAADSRVEYGLTPDTLTFSASDPSLTSAHTITLQGLNHSTTYHYRVRSADASANAATSPAPPAVPLTFTTMVPASLNCPCSIWSAAQTPALVTEPDSSAVELGLKFRTSVSGYITAIRFYKGSQNTGVHVGNLWTITGTQLATVTFVGETASGWQVAALPQPVAVTAGTIYVVSYHAPNGFYPADIGDLASAHLNGPLEALSSGTVAGNGVFRYGPSAFPTETAGHTNYWVDVVFETSLAPDVTPPAVTLTSPANQASNVEAQAPIQVSFNEAMAAGSITFSTLELRDAGSNLVAGSVSHDQLNRRATLQPGTPLAYSTTYTARVVGGTNGVTDLAGNALSADHTWTFTTRDPPPPPPDEGPGGPILVVAAANNAFTRYYAEVLRAEGLNGFLVSDISSVSPSVLAAHKVVILGEMALSPTQVTMLTDWVAGGGKLIAMRPDKQLAALLGLIDAGATLAEGYIRIDTSTSPGAGIVGETMQFHGTADIYELGGATPAATLYSDATTPTGAPAVTVRSVGTLGGKAAAFSFDLARSIVYTRQGNPAWSGQERDGLAPIRSNDLFFGGIQLDYVDRSKIAIPQADEQQRFLANLIGHLSSDEIPTPRFWYLPRGLKAVVVMTGDDHANNGTSGQFDWFTSRSAPGCNVANWECVRATSYIYPNTPISPAAAAAYTTQGFEIGVHISTACNDYTASSIAATYANELASFADAFDNLPAPRTNRTHCIAWSDYASQAETARAHGIRLDTNYYYWPGSWVNNVPGVFTGSAMPMRFARADGTMIDVYQAATQMTDESGQAYPFTANVLLDLALGAEGFYGAYVANMHTDFPNHAGARAIVDSAQARGVPVISAQQLLDWVDGRNASSYNGLTWVGNSLRFSIEAHAKAAGLQLLLPSVSGNRIAASVTRDGQPVSFALESIKGVSYIRFDSGSGDYSVEYAPDSTVPTISGVAVAADAFDATVTWTTSELATSRVEYGPSPNAMTSIAVKPSLATSHSVQLRDLAPGTAYYFRAVSVDIVGNVASAPEAPAAPFAFTTLVSQTFGCPCTIWPEQQIPSQPSAADTAAVEVGVKFRPSADGYVTAIRFYKGPLNTGAHVGNLWSGDGTLLATVAFANETVTGWQQAALPQAVALTANSTYVVSYHTSTGGYAFDPSYFQSGGVTSGPLQALAQGVDGGNGVFRYGSTGFPSQSFNSANYWVDLVFVTTLPPPSPAAVGVTDTTKADFEAGTPGAGIHVAHREDGEVILTPAVESFGGLTVPAGWTSMPWASGGVSSVANGVATVDGALLGSDMLVGPDQRLNFVATFTPVAFQHGGFALSFTENLWAMFSTGSAGTGLIARTHNGSTALETPLSASVLGSAHRYGIHWNGSNVQFFVDGVLVATHNTTINAQLRPTFSDFQAGGGALTVDSVEIGPYATSGTFVSRVLDVGSETTWTSAISTTEIPAGTTLQLSARFGNTPAPDGTWSSFAPLSPGTAPLSATSRYVQYEAALAGTAAATPALKSITFTGTDIPPTPTISMSGGSVVEGSSGTRYAVFLLSLSVSVANQVSVSYATADGTAGADDYATSTGIAVFPPGTTLVPVLIPIVTDTIIESDETFLLTLSAPVNGTLAQTQATATIVDDDIPALSISDASILEGDAGVLSALFTVSLSTPSNQEVSVSFATADGTAASAQDYVVTAGSVTFPVGVTTRQVAVPVLGDVLDEANETFTVTLSSAVNAPIVDATGTGTIADNDPNASLAIGDLTMTETDSGTASGIVTVVLSPASGRTVTVNYTTVNGAATSPADYLPASGSLSFAPGQTTLQIPVEVAGDLLDEPNETFFVNLTSPANATLSDSQGLVTIVDDDLPAITIGDVAVTEGNTGSVNAVFTVSLTSSTAQPTSVNYTTLDGTAVATADYTPRSGTLTIPAGQTVGQITVPVLGDTRDEPDEAFSILLSAPINGTIGDDTAVGTITDNDPTPSLVINNVTVPEGDTGTTPIAFTVTLSAASGQTVTVNYASADATATAPADYAAVSGTLTFAPGITTQQIATTVSGDTLEEPTETFQINLTAPVDATIADALGVGTITDNDPPLISINNRTVTEGNTGTTNVVFTVSLSFAYNQPVSVNYATADGTAVAPDDYTPVAGTLTIPAGATSGQIIVPMVGDVLDENNETYTVTLTSPVNGTIATGTGIGTITDNDATPSLTVTDATIAELDAGTVTATFTVTLSAVSGRTVTVNRSTANATATAPADYTALASAALTFPPGTTTQDVTVTVASDLLDEGDETFQVRLTNASNASIADGTGLGTIVDNDPTPTATINDVTITEANTGTRTMTFTVTLSAAAGRTITMSWATADGTATAPGDYTAATGTVTFNAGVVTRPITITTVGDTLGEPNETILVHLSNGVNVTILDNQGVGTILNND